MVAAIHTIFLELGGLVCHHANELLKPVYPRGAALV
jgi:hypothetical protein